VRTGAGVTTRTRYDAYGNLRDVYLPDGTHVAYVVDAQQRRTARLVNGVVTNRWLYQSQLAIAAEVDSAGTPIRTFTYGTHGNVPDLMTLANGRQYRLVTDHLGSVRLVIDVAADTVVQRLAYDAYGRVVVDTKPGFQPFGYAGGLYDPLTGLVRFGARDYDAESGRWTAKDPVGLRVDANLYAYARGSPLTFADFAGREPLTAIEIQRLGDLCARADCTRVSVARGRDGPFANALRQDILALSGGRSFTFGHHIFLGDQDLCDFAVLAHEVTHAAQFEQWGLPEYLRQGINERVYEFTGGRPYEYQLNGRRLERYGMEQQGQIVEDCFRGSNAACAVARLP